jgi:hypothetical protein
MAGKGKAVQSGNELRDEVVRVARALDLDVRTEVKVARRLWGAVRQIDVIVSDRASRRSLGIECKFQGSSGSAEEKIPATVQDIAAWPIPGIVVFEGEGFSKNMRAFLYSTGKAVELRDLRDWLSLFFAKGA